MTDLRCRKCNETCAVLTVEAFACDNCGDEYLVVKEPSYAQLEAELADKDRQLADAKAEIEQLKQLWSCNLDIIGGELNKQLADAKAEIERLKSEHEDSLRRAKNYMVSLSGTVTEQASELLAKDKLIEQTRAIFAEMLEKPRVEIWAWKNKIKELLEEI